MSVLAVPTSVRRHAWLAWLLAALWLLPRAAAAAPPDQTGSGRPALTLVWFDPAELLPFPFEWVACELRRTLSDVALQIDWREAQDNETVQPPEHPVILLREDPVASRSARRVMGGVEGRAASRPIWIFLSATEGSLWLNPHAPTVRARHQARALARALGRVLAHELVHVIAPQLPHARTGLMRPRLRLEDLAAPWPLRLDARSRAAVLRSLRQPAPSRPGLLAVRGDEPEPPAERIPSLVAP